MTLEKFQLIDRAATGDVEAAAHLAEGYYKGIYSCEKNIDKAKKWASYAAKHGNGKAAWIMEQIQLNRY